LNKTEKTISATVAIPEVAGDIDAHAITGYLEDKCKAEILRADAASTNTLWQAAIRIQLTY
jgi:hypothetical protein